MIKSVEDYLNQLEKELKGSDTALIHDALSDAEEHLRTGLAILGQQRPGNSESEALSSIVSQYGSPGEIAAAYREIDIYPPAPFPVGMSRRRRRTLAPFFGVLGDPHAWGAFFYMLVSVVTGCLFGLWALMGILLSAISLVFIIGIPVAGGFLLSIRGIALIEGRLVEAMLGTRMPRRPLFLPKSLGWTDKLKQLFTERYTWKILFYLASLFPLGLIYFFLVVLMFSGSVSLILSSLFELVFHLPLELFGENRFTPVWLLPVLNLTGLFLFVLMFHVVKFIGIIHARFARAMLILKPKPEEDVI